MLHHRKREILPHGRKTGDTGYREKGRGGRPVTRDIGMGMDGKGDEDRRRVGMGKGRKTDDTGYRERGGEEDR